MIRRSLIVTILCVGLLLVVGAFLLLPSKSLEIKDYQPVDRPPAIEPDYAGSVIPPNIAPLNFIINEAGERYYVKITSTNGRPIEIAARRPKIEIPLKPWQNLLSQNRGQEIMFNVYIEDEKGQWQQFQPIVNRVASEDIDGYLAYRLIHPAHHLWHKMGIFQRNIQNYDEQPILLNRVTDRSCMNCHSFCNNNPDQMMVHLRAGPASGTLLHQAGNLVKINTSTKFNKAGSYPAWHPSGKIIAFSVNKLLQFFHSVGESRDVLDRASDLILYQIESNTITTCPDIASPERLETFPTWSPDGNYLYFCSSPRLETYVAATNGDEDLAFDKIQYDLMRIRYYPENGTWGELETVLASAKTGLSILEPRISPDGRYLLFCMAKYGSFPVYQQNSDLYLLDLNTREYYKPEINSERAETFHSWSSNGRWFVFSSKRGDGLCARPYFSYLDEQGRAHKPFVLPQKDPEFYESFLTTYNVPELIKAKVTVRPQLLTSVAYDAEKTVKAKLDPRIRPRPDSDTSSDEGTLAPQ